MLLWRVTTTFTGIAGSPWYSTFHFERSLAGPADVVDRTRDFWTFLGVYIHTDVNATVSGDVPVIDDSTGQITIVESTPDLGVVYDGVGDVLPPATQGMVRWGTGVYVNGRQLQGKTFIPGIIENYSQLGVPNATVTAALTTAAAGLHASGTEQLRVFSPTHLTSAVVQTAQVLPKWAVLRSRRD